MKNISLFFVIYFFIILIKVYLKSIRKNNSVVRLIISKSCKNILVFIIVFSMLGYLSIKYKEAKFEKVYVQENLVVTIVSKEIEEEYYNKYIAKVDKYNVNIYIMTNKKIKFQYGDKLELKDKIIASQGQRNSYGFNYRMYLRSINIAGTITIKDNNYKIIDRKSKLINKLIYEIQESIREKIYKIIKSENKYLLEALLIGNKDNISNEISKLFRESSLSHLLAISGTHVAIIATLIFRLFKFIKIGKKKTYYISIVIIFLYIFIAGETPSVIRSCIGIILGLFSKIIHRKSDIYTNMSISSIIILLINPYNIINLGFILSYGGVIGILLYTSIIKNKSHQKGIKVYIKENCIISFCVQIIIFPIIVNSFNNISFTFFISNLIASPLLSLILNLGIIAILLSYLWLPVAYFIAQTVDKLIDILINFSDICANIPFSNNICTRIDLPIIIIYYILIAYIIYLIKINRIHIIVHFLKKHILKLICIFLIIALAINLYNNSGIKGLKIYFIDVGQGDATLIKTAYNKVILIDGGEPKEGENTLLPYLLNKKIRTIDYIFISHFDSDHVRTDYFILWKI